MHVLPFAKTKRLLFVALLLAIAVFSGNCKKDNSGGGAKNDPGPDPLKPVAEVTTTISGTVVDEQGKPVAGAMIIAGDESATSGESGGFELEAISVPGNRCVVTCKKEGYFESIRAAGPRKDGITSFHMVLMSASPTHSFTASAGGKATLTNGSEVTIPANAVIDASGNTYAGKVNMAVRYLDPTVPGFASLVSGGDMLAERTDNRTSILYSYGILRVKLTGIDGADLQLAEGKSASLVMDIPDKQLATAPATIPLWFFDEEKGHWVEEGAATRQGDKYKGTVNHFTDWNCDTPEESATIIGKLVDCHGEGTWGHIEFGQIGEDAGNSSDTEQSDGTFRQRVPAGISMTITVYDPLYIAPLLPDDQGKGKLIVIVPPLAPGQVYDAGVLQIFPCMSSIKADFKLKAGDEIENIGFNLPGGGSRYFASAGTSFSLGGFPPLASMEMTVKTVSGIRFKKNITTAAGGSELDLGLIDISTEQVAYITGKLVCGNNPVADGQVAANWNVSGNNPQIEYTIPASDGTFRIPVSMNQSIVLFISTSKGSIERSVNSSSVAGGTTDLGVIDLCTGPQPGENSYTITGDGYTNKNVVLTPQPYPVSGSFYFSAEGLTSVSVNDITDTVRFVITFPGKQTGVAPANDDTGVFIQRKSGQKYINYIAGMGVTGSAVTVNVTRYDAVGGLIEGTFQGTFMKDDTHTVTITNGKFSMHRQGDL